MQTNENQNVRATALSKQPTHRGFRKLPILLIAILVALTISFFWQKIVFLAHSKSVTGVVTSVDSKIDSCGPHLLKPCTRFTAKIEYADSSGRNYEIFDTQWKDGERLPIEEAPFKPGAKVKLLDDPANPSNAIIDSFGEKWAAVIFPLVLIIVLLSYYKFPIVGSLLDMRRRN
jgi:hypothetical protein